MSKKRKNIARFIHAAMGIYPNLRPFAAVTHYGAWLMSENKRLKELPLAYGTQTDKARAVPAERLGDFGKLFVDYEGCPRGAIGRAGGTPIEEEVLAMKPIWDVDGGEWIPVNADALRELVKKYKSLKNGARMDEEEK